jgi:hypothetical protein
MSVDADCRRPEEDCLGPRISVTASPANPQAGEALTLTATLTNDCRTTLRRTVLYLGGHGSAADPLHLGDVRPDATVTKTRRVHLPADAEGTLSFDAHANFDVGDRSSDCARASQVIQLPYRTLRGSFDNRGISDDARPDGVDFDGSGSSLSTQALASVGCTPGATITRDGARFTWPDITPGAFDNVVCSGQTILLAGSGSRLAFLGTSTWGVGKGSGTVRYTDGTETPFSVEVNDWYGSNPVAAVVVPYRTISGGRDDTPVSLYAFSAPLRQDKQVRAVVLPNVSPGVRAGVPALHVFAMTVVP